MEKDMSRAERRKKDYSKALRKKWISNHIYGLEYYDSIHAYSKNKVHCSCPMCSAKTNDKKFKNGGKRWSNTAFDCWGTTNQRKGKNWNMADLKRVQSMLDEIKELEL